jgi:chromate transporter
MENEIVTKRKWLTHQEFIYLIGATNLIPGPNSTEVAIHIGYLLKGRKGLFVAGLSFILPSIFIMILLAMVYITYGSTPEVISFLYGVKPIVIIIILNALLSLWKKTSKDRILYFIPITIVFLSLTININEVILLLTGALIGTTILELKTRYFKKTTHFHNENFTHLHLISNKQFLITGLISFGLWLVFGIFFIIFAQISDNKAIEIGSFFYIISSTLYGSGYVLFAFIEGGFVRDRGLITENQLIDAIAIGQLKPGPVFATATFLGFLIDGFPGAFFATIGIFLPPFLFVLVLNPIIPELRRKAITSKFLDSINLSALGLMFVVLSKLSISALIDIPSFIIAIIAVILIFKYKTNTFIMILFGFLAGFLIQTFIPLTITFFS